MVTFRTWTICDNAVKFHLAGLCKSTRKLCGSLSKCSDLHAMWHARDHTSITSLFLTCRAYLCYDAALWTHVEEFHIP